MKSLALGLHDLKKSLLAWRLWTLLGWLEIRQRYARSKLGPFWLTVSMGVMVGTLGLVYGTLFKQSLQNYLPMIAIGIIIWNLFSSVVSEGTQAYIVSAHYLKQVHTSKLIYIFQSVWRQTIIFAHNFVIIILVLAIFKPQTWWTVFYFIPGFVLFLLNATWMAAVLGLVSARFRDLPQIVSAGLQVAFYVTPILFSGSMLKGQHEWIVRLNPLSYLIDVVRLPLLGIQPTQYVWLISSSMAVLGWLFALWITGRYQNRLPFWV